MADPQSPDPGGPTPGASAPAGLAPGLPDGPARRQGGMAALGLTAASPPGARIVMKALAEEGRLNLRLDPARAASVGQVGWPLPLEANRVTEAGEGRRALWLGPDEWLLAMPLGSVPEAQQALETALAGAHHALVDLSDNYASLQVIGAPAGDLLSKGCPLDLDPAVFQVGHVAQSLVGKADAIIERRPDAEPGRIVLEVTVRRSFARYVWEWLADGAREFGLAVRV
jgi:sarcosine oxidase subunit gamma